MNYLLFLHLFTEHLLWNALELENDADEMDG